MLSRVVRTVAIAFLVGAPTAAAQPRAADAEQLARVRRELRALVDSANAAILRRDRAALERLYAEEYVWAHSLGYVDDRKTHVEQTLAVDSLAPMRMAFDPPAELHVFGDVALLRTRARGTAVAGGRPVLNSTWFAKRDGRWLFLQAQGTLLQPERTAVPVADALLDAYAGSYGTDGRATTAVRRDGATLVVRAVGSSQIPPRVLVPVADTAFFDKLGTEYRFRREPDGRVSHLVIRAQTGQESRRDRMP